MKQEEHRIQEFEISDTLWARIEPLLPERAKPVHPLGCHRPRVPDRKVLNSLFYLLRTGGQWHSLNSLDPTRYAKRSTAHTRFQEWLEEGFFARLRLLRPLVGGEFARL
jgi:putative transposase